MDSPPTFPLIAALPANIAALAITVAVHNLIKREEIRRRVRDSAGKDSETGIGVMPRPRLRKLMQRLDRAMLRLRWCGVGGFVIALWYAGAQNVSVPFASQTYWTIAAAATWLCALLPALVAVHILQLFSIRDAIENELK